MGEDDYTFKIDSDVTNHVDSLTVCETACPTTYTSADDLFTTDTGSEYTSNISYDTSYTSSDGFTINIPGYDNRDTWPSEYKVKEMIEKYPALKIQYEKFLAIYNLIKDDHKGDLDELLE